jgi:hypothetical protein
MNMTDQDFMLLVHRVSDLERRVTDLEKSDPSILDTVGEAKNSFLKGASSLLSKASKAIGPNDPA